MFIPLQKWWGIEYQNSYSPETHSVCWNKHTASQTEVVNLKQLQYNEFNKQKNGDGFTKWFNI